jgi:predicted TIM-barrel fold metal-dependent hydrolase
MRFYRKAAYNRRAIARGGQTMAARRRWTFIDIHVHTRQVPGPKIDGRQPYTTAEQLLKRYDKLGIQYAVVLPGVNPECANDQQSTQEVLELCARHRRLVPFCNVDPRALSNSGGADLSQLLSYYKQRGCRGIGEVCANLPFLDDRVQNLFKHAELTGLPLTFHVAPQIGGIYGLYDDPGLPQLERSLQCFKRLRFLGHSQAFWAEMAPLQTPADRYGYPKYPVREEGVVPRLFRRYPNLLGDLSANSGCNALARDPDYAVRFLDEFQDRLFFGTDICAPTTPTPLVDFLLDLRQRSRISETIFRKVAYENAQRLLALS